jgi:hypothetical protein
MSIILEIVRCIEFFEHSVSETKYVSIIRCKKETFPTQFDPFEKYILDCWRNLIR